MNTLGILNIGTYVPVARASNAERLSEFEIDATFLESKLGVRTRAIKAPNESTADLCLRAAEDLVRRGGPRMEDVDCVVVISQNPGVVIPHVSARIHGELKLKSNCACYDISLGCSGYVYGLANVLAFMQMHGFRNGLIFTADPYSSIIDPSDKNTSLLFGDAATCTWVGVDPLFVPGEFTFGTDGTECSELSCAEGGSLFMNGRAIFNFAAKRVPAEVKRLLTENNLHIDDVDRFVFHQGSKYIVDTLTKLMRLAPEKVAFDIFDYGNTVSSSIPLILANELERPDVARIVICGFGAGLSWASALLTKTSPLCK